MFRLTRLILALTLTCIAWPANACRVAAEQRLEDIRHADAIFVGKLDKYELVTPGPPSSLADYGLLTISVERTLQGKVPKKIQIHWRNSTFGMPEKLDEGETFILAASSSDSKRLPLRGPSATISPSDRPDLMQLLQAPCSSPFFFPYTSEKEAEIKAVLQSRNTEAEGGKTSAPTSPPIEGKADKDGGTNKSEEGSIAKIMTASAAIAIAIFTGVYFKSRRG